MSMLSQFFKRISRWVRNSSQNIPPPAVFENKGGSQNKRALCVAINDYEGSSNDLAGCVNDLNDWESLLVNKYGFSKVETLVDSQATIAAVSTAMSRLVASAVPGDVIAITYSGHGSYVPDRDGDELDGKDETLYLHDGNLTDDEIRSILSGVKDGVRLTVVCDSCHSGTVTRMVLKSSPDSTKIRFHPPDDESDWIDSDFLPTKRRVFFDEEFMRHILIAGCGSDEYCYDASFNQRPNGAFTYNAVAVLNENPDRTYEEFYAELRKRMPSQKYPQTPQLEGGAEMKKTKIFS